MIKSCLSSQRKVLPNSRVLDDRSSQFSYIHRVVKLIDGWNTNKYWSQQPIWKKWDLKSREQNNNYINIKSMVTIFIIIICKQITAVSTTTIEPLNSHYWNNKNNINNQNVSYNPYKIFCMAILSNGTIVLVK